MFNDIDDYKEIETFEPTLGSSAMLVSQSIGVWEGKRTDHAVGDEVTRQKMARKGSARVQKDLLPNCAELITVKQFRNTARTYHRDHTLDWAGPLKLLTVEQYIDYNPTATGQRQEFYQLVEQFLRVYPTEVAKAHVALGNLFNAEDYPTVDELRGKFHFDIDYMPLPEKGDFRVDIEKEAKEELKSSYGNFFQKQMKTAMADIWNQLAESLQNMSGRLDYDEHEKPTGFRDTLVSNVLDKLDLMKKCNIANDPEMERVRQQLQDTLRAVTPDRLREDSWLRKDTKRTVDQVIKNLPTTDI